MREKEKEKNDWTILKRRKNKIREKKDKIREKEINKWTIREREKERDKLREREKERDKMREREKHKKKEENERNNTLQACCSVLSILCTFIFRVQSLTRPIVNQHFFFYTKKKNFKKCTSY